MEFQIELRSSRFLNANKRPLIDSRVSQQKTPRYLGNENINIGLIKIEYTRRTEIVDGDIVDNADKLYIPGSQER